MMCRRRSVTTWLGTPSSMVAENRSGWGGNEQEGSRPRDAGTCEGLYWILYLCDQVRVIARHTSQDADISMSPCYVHKLSVMTGSKEPLSSSRPGPPAHTSLSPYTSVDSNTLFHHKPTIRIVANYN